MRILVATPITQVDGSPRLFGRALQSIYRLQWEGGLDFFQGVGGDDPRDPTGSCARKYQAAQDVFLRGSWDALLCAEYDMIVPRDGLQKLAALDADIAYGLYVMRHGSKWWSAASHLDEHSWVSLSADPPTARAAWGRVVPVAGVGLGFTLIHRHVLEAHPFHWWKGVCVDWALGCDAQAAGLRQVCDLSVVCGHISLLPSPRVYWPDPADRKLVRTEELSAS